MGYDPAGSVPVANTAEKLPSACTTADWVTPWRVTDTTEPDGATVPARRVPDRVTEGVPKTIVGELRPLNDGVTATVIGNVCWPVVLPTRSWTVKVKLSAVSVTSVVL